MKTLYLLLFSVCILSNATAQWTYSARSSVGLSYSEDHQHDNDEKGGVYSVGAQLAYDFHGRIGEVSIGLDYERYRDFNVHRDFYTYSENHDPSTSTADIRHRNAIEGWSALRLNVGVEGPFIVLPDDGPLRMFVNGGVMITTAVKQYGTTIILPDSAGNFATDKVNYSIYDGALVDDGRKQSALKQLNLFAGFGLAYRLTPRLSASAGYEVSLAPIGKKYGGVYVDPLQGYTETWSKQHFAEIQNFRLGVVVRVF